MKALFVTGTDTDVGKTVVVTLLARFLKEKGIKVVSQKWVQTGCESLLSEDSDIKRHLCFMNENLKNYEDFINDICPYIFKFPSSPHLAAALEKKEIKKNKIITAFKKLTDNFEFIIVEGSGGLFVPINESTLLIDIVKELDLPVLLVSANKLGAINHTLLSVEALQTRGLTLESIIFNNINPEADRKIIEDNKKIVSTFVKTVDIFSISYSDNLDILYNEFIANGSSFLRRLVNEIRLG